MKFSIIFVRNCISPTTRPMKRLSQLLLFISFAITANAQLQLDDFYKQGSSWCEIEEMPINKSPTLRRFHTCTIVHDSLINNKTYHLVGYSAYDNYGNTTYNSIVVGGVRVSSDSIYFISLYKFNWQPDPNGILENNFDRFFPIDTEKLLYKYDVHPGDQFNFPGRGYKIISVDTVQLSNGQRISSFMIYDSANNFRYYWIKGVGSTSSFFGAYGSRPYSLSLYYSNPSFEYLTNPTSSYSNCFPSSVAEVSTKKQFNIYPNPFTDNTLHITSIGIEKLSLADITGKIVYATSGIPSGDIALDIYLSPGMYILKAQLADGSIKMQKIVKQ